MRPTAALRAMLKGAEIVVAPGVYDGLSARLAHDAGFADTPIWACSRCARSPSAWPASWSRPACRLSRTPTPATATRSTPPPARTCCSWRRRDLQRAAIRAMQEVLAVMRRDGTSRALAGRMATFAEREPVVRTREYLELDRRYSG